MDDVGRAQAVAAKLLAHAPSRRWRHVAGVAARAAEVSSHLGGVDRVVVVAAWLHDVGYSPDLIDTGFHPLDGARFLRRGGFDDRVACLVAYHSYAGVEADLRGLGPTLNEEFRQEESLTSAALCYCDMTTSVDGNWVDVVDRLEEIRTRYGPGDVVTQFVDRAEPEILATVRRVEGLLLARQPR